MSYLGIDVTSVKAAAEHQLGLEVSPDSNPQNVYRYVQADDAVTQYDAVTIDTAVGGSGSSANVPYVVTPTAAADTVIYGVAQVAFTAGYYGFVLIKGAGTVNAATTVVAEAHAVPTATAGQLDDTAASAANALALASGVGVIFTSTATSNLASCFLT